MRPDSLFHPWRGLFDIVKACIIFNSPMRKGKRARDGADFPALTTELKMNKAHQFDLLMDYLWGSFDDTHNKPLFITRAVGDRLRGTHGINPENAFDVLAIAHAADFPILHWEVHPHIPNDESHMDSTAVNCHVTFDDQSKLLIIVRRGIGSAIEMMS